MSNHRQLSLEIIPRLAYSPDGFYLHSGISEVSRAVEKLLLESSFQIIKIKGSARSGKTHLSLYFADLAYRKMRFPRLLDGDQFASWIDQRMERSQIHSDEVIIVDDADSYLRNLRPGDSGPFVNFVEACRKKGAKILFLLNDSGEAFAYDEHVASRLLAGHEYQIAQPSDEELSELTLRLARQRGMSLTERHTQYLARRIPRNIEAVEKYLDRVSRMAQSSGAPVRMPLLSRAL